METAPEATLTDCCCCRLYTATLPSYLTKVALSHPFLYRGEKGIEIHLLSKAINCI